jgi:SPP1 gp7 family putative phage head morphogenesis protein
MSRRLVDVEDKNRYLFNLLFRHQVYLEGVKAGFSLYYRHVLNNLYGEFAKYIGQNRYATLDGFTRVELQQFIRRFQLAQTHFYSRYTQQLIKLLQDFVAADVVVMQAIYQATTGQTTVQRSAAPQPDDLPPILGIKRTHGTKAGNALLWASIANTPVPANGMTIQQMLDSFVSSASTKVTQQITKGYANAETGQDTLAFIVGERDTNFRDGLFSTFNNQNIAILATILQHASSITQAAVASVHFNEYQWVAMLDSRTTEICRSRNGNVYIYGEGPLPPAHYNCRSKAVSLAEGDALHDIPDTYFDWLITQPEDVLADMLGTVTAAKIIARSSTVKDISVSNTAIPLTVEEFRAKIDFITV